MNDRHTAIRRVLERHRFDLTIGTGDLSARVEEALPTPEARTIEGFVVLHEIRHYGRPETIVSTPQTPTSPLYTSEAKARQGRFMNARGARVVPATLTIHEGTEA